MRALVARRWAVDGADLVLDFGTATAGDVPAGALSLELLGSGGEGHWIVRAASDGGGQSTLHVRAGMQTRVRVAARALSRGQTLSEADMADAMEVRWGEPLPAGTEAAQGWVVKRMLRRGEPLRSPSVQPPLAVASGRPVDIVWQRSGVAIKLRGRALGSAPLGKEIYVRTESGERLRGVVRAPGVVDVTPGGTDR